MEPHFPGDPPTPMTVQCPHCAVQLSVPSTQAGQVGTCRQCNGKFQLPLPTAHVQSQPGQTTRQEFIDKKLAAGLCGILVGGLGVHKFVLGFNNAGILMLCLWLAGGFLGLCIVIPIVVSLAMQTIGLVEGILYLTKSDDEFYQAYAIEKREWF